MSARALPSLLYMMANAELGVRTAAARCLRNVTASASREIKSVVAHNGGAAACISLLAEVSPQHLVRCFVYRQNRNHIHLLPAADLMASFLSFQQHTNTASQSSFFLQACEAVVGMAFKLACMKSYRDRQAEVLMHAHCEARVRLLVRAPPVTTTHLPAASLGIVKINIHVMCACRAPAPN